MITTAEQLCNIALLRVGERQTIDTLNENTQPARACKALYAPARDSLLEENWWGFATKRSTLALTTEERDGWGYAYSTPSDCLTPRYIWTGVRNPAPQYRVPFASELNTAGGGYLILTDHEAPSLVYTAHVTTPALWSSLFVDALAWRLAIDLSLGLSVKPQVALAMRQAYAQARDRAIAFDLRDGQGDQLPDSELITVRS